MSDTNQIGELLPQLMRAIGNIGKDGVNTNQSYNFRGVDSVLNNVGPAAAALGIAVQVEVSEYQNNIVHYKKNGYDKFRVHVSLKMSLKFTAPDGSYHCSAAYGEGQDTQGDKATNKAMSAAFKYANFFGLVIPVAGSLDDSDHDDKSEPVEEKWNDWIVPLGKIKGKTLGELVIAGEMEAIEKLLVHLKNVFDPESEHAEGWQRQIDWVKEALLEEMPT